MNNLLGAVGCGNQWLATIYFLSFQLFVTMILLNLFIAVILQAFDESSKNEEAIIKNTDLDTFKKLWRNYDVKAVGMISHSDVERLIKDLSNPFSKKQFRTSSLEFSKFMFTCEIPGYQIGNGEELHYHFYDVLLILSKKAMQESRGSRLDIR